MADNTMPAAFQSKLPKELLAAAQRTAKPKGEQLRVEGWRNSWFTKLSEIIVGRD
jgi:hypothetical protein